MISRNGHSTELGSTLELTPPAELDTASDELIGPDSEPDGCEEPGPEPDAPLSEVCPSDPGDDSNELPLNDVPDSNSLEVRSELSPDESIESLVWSETERDPEVETPDEIVDENDNEPLEASELVSSSELSELGGKSDVTETLPPSCRAREISQRSS
jgi:hypothetical protein